MGGIDELRVLGARPVDPLPGGVDLEVEGDGDDLEALVMELSSQALPPGQRGAATSPRCPRGNEHLLAAQRREVERPAIDVGQRELGQRGGLQALPAGLRAERPQAVALVVYEWHPESLRDCVYIDRATRISLGKRDAPLAAAEALGLEFPSARGFEVGG